MVTTPITRQGRLFIVSTPIGNLEDITLRALKTLKEVDLIAAEDTRKTKKLLNHYQIRTPLTSYFDHNEFKKGKFLITKITNGNDIALVTDAGTPGISDPGYHLIQLALKNSIDFVPVPGVSAAITALSVSGLPTDRFTFEGFLPSSQKKRRIALEKNKYQKRTIIYYESPRRLLTTLEDLLEIFGDRLVTIARELTKLYEEVLNGTISEIFNKFKNQGLIKGELTIIIGGYKGISEDKDVSIQEEIKLYQKTSSLPLKDIVRIISEEKGIPKRDIYQESLKLREQS